MANLKPSSALYTEYKRPLRIVFTIFLCWGFITVINGYLIQELGIGMKLTGDEVLTLQYIFYGSYFVFGLPAGILIRKFGFKRTLMIGLLTAASSVFFLVMGARGGNYDLVLSGIIIQAAGFTILQVTANPYVILLGEPKYGAARLSLAGAFNSFGTWLAPLLGSLIVAAEIPQDIVDPEAIQSFKTELVVLPYVLISTTFVGLTVLVNFSDMPPINAVGDFDHNMDSSSPKRTLVIHAVLSFLAIFFYVGAEVAIGDKIRLFIDMHLAPGDELHDALKYIIPYYWGGAMVGRFVGASVLRNVPAGKALGAVSLVAILLIVGAVMTPTKGAMFPILAIGLFNGIMWPAIFDLAVRGMGKYTPLMSTILIMGILGGAVIPFIVNTSFSNPENVTISEMNMALGGIIVCYVFIAFYAYYGHKYKKKEDYFGLEKK